MSCPKCTSSDKIRNGFVKGVQRYKCKKCDCNYTISGKILLEKATKKQLAVSLYSEGHSFHAVSRILSVSHVTIMNWIRKHESDAIILLIFFQCYLNFIFKL